MNLHRTMFSALSLAAVTAIAAAAPAAADTPIALGVRAGTLGFGPELTIGLNESLSVRVGYDAYSRNQTVTNTSATYNGSLKLDNGNALLVWSPGGYFFHVAAGAEITNTKIDVTGVPVGGNFTLGSTTYPSADITSVTGHVKMGHGVAPYAGIGFGNPVGSGAHLTFQFDVGAVFTGTPTANLTVVCSPAGAAVCPQIQQNAQVEIGNLESKTTNFKVWPVVNLGLAWRF